MKEISICKQLIKEVHYPPLDHDSNNYQIYLTYQNILLTLDNN